MSKFTKLLIALLFIFLIEIILIYRGYKTSMQISNTSAIEKHTTWIKYGKL